MLNLEELSELDRIEVQTAERLAYKGVLPRVKVQNLLSDLEQK